MNHCIPFWISVLWGMLDVIVCQHWTTSFRHFLKYRSSSLYLGSLCRAWKVRCLEEGPKPAQTLIMKHSEDLFLHQPVFFEGLETGLLISFKIWLLEDIIVANTFTCITWQLSVESRPRIQWKNTNAWDQKLGPYQGQLSHCTMVQCWSQNKQPPQKTQPDKDLTPFHAPHIPSAVSSSVQVLYVVPYSVSHFSLY